MAQYAGAHFRAGHMGYVGFQGQTVRLVGASAVADPALPGGEYAHIGACPYPGWDENNNIGDVESAASNGQDLSKYAGRREHVVRTTVEIANGAIFANDLNYLIRNRTTPAASGLYKGLRVCSLHFGCEQVYSEEDFAKIPVDCLMNSVGFTFAEGQPVRAAVEWWPTAVLESATGYNVTTTPPGDVLVWQHCSFTNNGTDYYPIMARVSPTITNNLIRVGMHKEIWTNPTTEARISRTVLGIVPGVEKITMGMEFHDEPPAILRQPYNWGTFIMRAEHPAANYYATKRFFQIALTANWTGRVGQPEIAPGQPFQFTSDVAGIGCVITAGTV